jgi:hypothetical protein
LLFPFVFFLQNNNLSADVLANHGILASTASEVLPATSSLPAFDFLGFPPISDRRYAHPAPKIPASNRCEPQLLGQGAIGVTTLMPH